MHSSNAKIMAAASACNGESKVAATEPARKRLLSLMVIRKPKPAGLVSLIQDASVKIETVGLNGFKEPSLSPLVVCWLLN